MFWSNSSKNIKSALKSDESHKKRSRNVKFLLTDYQSFQIKRREENLALYKDSRQSTPHENKYNLGNIKMKKQPISSPLLTPEEKIQEERNLRLIEAIESEDLAEVLKALDGGADRWYENGEPLHVAVRHDFCEIALLLLSYRDCKLKNGNSAKPLNPLEKTEQEEEEESDVGSMICHESDKDGDSDGSFVVHSDEDGDKKNPEAEDSDPESAGSMIVKEPESEPVEEEDPKNSEGQENSDGIENRANRSISHAFHEQAKAKKMKFYHVKDFDPRTYVEALDNLALRMAAERNLLKMMDILISMEASIDPKHIHKALRRHWDAKAYPVCDALFYVLRREIDAFGREKEAYGLPNTPYYVDINESKSGLNMRASDFFIAKAFNEVMYSNAKDCPTELKYAIFFLNLLKVIRKPFFRFEKYIPAAKVGNKTKILQLLQYEQKNQSKFWGKSVHPFIDEFPL